MAVDFSNPTIVSNPVGVQSSYTLVRNNGLEGSISGLEPHNTVTKENGTDSVIPFGHAVFSHWIPDNISLPTGPSNAYLMGIAVDCRVFEAAYGKWTTIPTALTADGRTGYPHTQRVNVLTKGIIRVYTAEDVKIGDSVRIYHTDSAYLSANGAYKGRFGKSSEANKTFHIVSGARWVDVASAGEYASLELDLADVTLQIDKGSNGDDDEPIVYNNITTEDGAFILTESGNMIVY